MARWHLCIAVKNKNLLAFSLLFPSMLFALYGNYGTGIILFVMNPKLLLQIWWFIWAIEYATLNDYIAFFYHKVAHGIQWATLFLWVKNYANACFCLFVSLSPAICVNSNWKVSLPVKDKILLNHRFLYSFLYCMISDSHLWKFCTGWNAGLYLWSWHITSRLFFP